MATSKTPRANRRTSRATTPSRVGQRPSTRSTAQTPKQSNLGPAPRPRLFEMDQDDANEVPDLLEEGGTTTATSLSFDSSGGSPASSPSVAGVLPKPGVVPPSVVPKTGVVQKPGVEPKPASNDIQPQEVHLPEPPENTQVQAVVQKTGSRGRARSATPRPDSGKAQQPQLARKTRSRKNDRTQMAASAISSVASQPDADKSKAQVVQKQPAGKNDRSLTPPKATSASAAKPSTAQQPDASNSQHQDAQKKGASKKNSRSRRRQKAATAPATSAVVPQPNAAKTGPQPGQKKSAGENSHPAAAATPAVVSQPPLDKIEKTPGCGRSKAPSPLSGKDQDRAGAVPGPPKLREEVEEPDSGLVLQPASTENQVQTTGSSKKHPRPPSPLSVDDQDRAGAAPGPPQLREEVGRSDRASAPPLGVLVVPQLATNKNQLQAEQETRASKTGTPGAALSAVRQPSSGSGVGRHASDEYKLLVRLQEKLASNETSARDVFKALASQFEGSELQWVLGKTNLSYLIAKLNFECDDTLSRELQSFRSSDELRNLTERVTEWEEVRQTTRIDLDLHQPFFVDLMMQVLTAVSKNVHALRIFTGFLVHLVASLKVHQVKDLLAKIGIATDIPTKPGEKPFKLVSMHLFLNCLYDSDIGSSTANLRVCCLGTEDTSPKLKWCFGDAFSDRSRGWDHAPGCEVIDNRISPPRDWEIAFNQADAWIKRGRLNDDGGVSPEETHEHFSALAEAREEDVASILFDLFSEGASIARDVKSRNLPYDGPWRNDVSQLIQKLTIVNQGDASAASAARVIQTQARLPHATSMTSGVEAIYPIALGFVSHSPKFLAWTKKYLEDPSIIDIGKDTVTALERAVSDVESGASKRSDLDPRFSGRLITLDSLRVCKVLGSGNFGTVVLAVSREGCRYRVAVKLEVMKEEEFFRYFWRPLVCSFTVTSRNVARLYSYDSFKVPPQGIHCVNRNTRFERHAENHVCTVLYMEAGGDTLADELEKRGEQKSPFKELIIESLRNVLQILNGLVAIHKLNWIHRDIKPANVVRGHHGELQIVDLGLSRIDEYEDEATKKPGTTPYIPPRMRDTKGFVDVFAVGVILHESICGYRPDQNPKTLREPKQKATVKHMFIVADSPYGKEVIALSKEMREGKYTAEDAMTAVETLLREFEKKLEGSKSS